MTEDQPLSGAARRDEISTNLAEFRERVDAACKASGRDPAGVHLIAITKTFPASDVRLLAELGVTDVGENRDQEAAPKHAECADLALRWHFVGGLQRNKCRSVVRYAAVVHSVDRPALVTALSRAAVEVGRTIGALVQVSLDPDATPPGARSGVAPAEVPRLADLIAAAPGLSLDGVMAVAPLGADPDEPFARLARLAASVQSAHPAATMISAGMSSDFPVAIRHGATHLRVGTALLGARSALVR